MKKLFTIQDSLTNKITYYHLILFVVSLPYDRFYSEVILISLTIHTLIHLRKSDLARLPLRQVLLVQGVFFLTIGATIYTVYPALAFKEWEKQLGIFLFPLVFALTSLDLWKYRARILSAFAVGCSIAVTYLEWETVKVIRFAGLPVSALFTDAFINQNFTEPIGIHPTYLAIYVALSLSIFVNFIISRSSALIKGIGAMAVLILCLSLVQLGSKSVLFAFILIMVICPALLSNNRYKKELLFLSPLLLIVTLATVYQFTALKKRFVVELIQDLSNEDIGKTKNEYRIVRWQAAIDLIKRAPIIGYGTGSELPLLKKKYYERKLYNSFVNELNTHNQYLSVMIKSGFIGLLVFLYTLFSGFSLAAKKRDIVMLGFFTIVAVVSLSENLLEVNKGIFYYSFFFSLFVFASRKPTYCGTAPPEEYQQIKQGYKKKTVMTI